MAEAETGLLPGILPSPEPIRRQLIRLKGTLELRVPDIEQLDDAGAVVSVILLDYCVESLLKTIIAATRTAPTGPRDPKFHETWEAASSIVKDPKWGIKNWEIPYGSSIKNLHLLRNATQHADQVPAHAEIHKYRAVVEELFEETLRHAFGIEVGALTLATLVRSKDLKPLLEAAYRLHAEGAWEQSLFSSTEAVVRLVQFAERRVNPDYRVHLDGFSLFDRVDDRQSREALEKLSDAVQETREQTAKQMLHLLGLDWKDYERFTKSTPNVLIMAAGNADCTFMAGRDYGEAQSKFALEFAVKNVLRMEAIGIVHEDPRLARRAQQIKPA